MERGIKLIIHNETTSNGWS